MANFLFLLFFLSSSALFLYYRPASAFSSKILPSTNKHIQFQSRQIPQGRDNSSVALYAGFEQLPGESTTEFIKRITEQSNELLDRQKNGESVEDTKVDKESKPIGKYQRIEEWDEERNAKGELSWEEKVQFDGQRYGNQVKQDSILRRQLGGFR